MGVWYIQVKSQDYKWNFCIPRTVQMSCYACSPPPSFPPPSLHLPSSFPPPSFYLLSTFLLYTFSLPSLYLPSTFLPPFSVLSSTSLSSLFHLLHSPLSTRLSEGTSPAQLLPISLAHLLCTVMLQSLHLSPCLNIPFNCEEEKQVRNETQLAKKHTLLNNNNNGMERGGVGIRRGLGRSQG